MMRGRSAHCNCASVNRCSNASDDEKREDDSDELFLSTHFNRHVDRGTAIMPRQRKTSYGLINTSHNDLNQQDIYYIDPVICYNALIDVYYH